MKRYRSPILKLCHSFFAISRSNPARAASGPASDPCQEYVDPGDPCHRISRSRSSSATMWDCYIGCFEGHRLPVPMFACAEWGKLHGRRRDYSRIWPGPYSISQKWDQWNPPRFRRPQSARTTAPSPMSPERARHANICAYVSPLRSILWRKHYTTTTGELQKDGIVGNWSARRNAVAGKKRISSPRRAKSKLLGTHPIWL